MTVPNFLFEKIRVESERYWHEIRAQTDQGVISFPPSRVEDVGHILFSSLVTGGFCTLPVAGNQPWDPRSHYYEAARFAARMGRKIERAFLLPNRLCRHDASLSEHVALDQASGIKTHVLHIGDLLSTLELPSLGSLDFGLWDNEILCVAIGGSTGQWPGLSEWQVSNRPEDLELAKSIVTILMSKAVPLTLDSTESGAVDLLDLEEPLVTTAPIADFVSSFMCRGSYLSPEDCSWYHSVWQYLRVFNMVSTPTWHLEFYGDELGKLASSGNHPRVLISGTADYSMLAHVIWAYRRCHANLTQVTVLDLCETPLFLCKWYAKLTSNPISTVVADIFEYKTSSPFDLIVTDAFLTRFARDQRLRVVRKWAGLLRSGGRVVTTVRLDPGLSSNLVRATPQQADAFRQRAFREARRWQDFLIKNPEDVANKAQRYAERMTSYPVSSEEEIHRLFSENSFRVEQLRLAEVPGEMAGTVYAEILAERL